MKPDSRLSRMLHVLLHMDRVERPLTSEEIAPMLRTNPVVVRRTLGALREAGLVRSEKGHGGGWTLTCDLRRVTLLDVHRALGNPAMVSIGIDDPRPECPVEAAVNRALDDAGRRAEALLAERLAEIPLASLVQDFDRRCAAVGLASRAERER